MQRLTGVYVDHSTQQRLVHRQEFAELEVGETVTELSIDGGKARLRTEKGQASEWRDYKAITLNKQTCAAFFQENDKLLASVNAQPLADPVTCLGDAPLGIFI